ncbi:MAG: hypothetical protein OHK0045_15360 [Raineya sp.]
MTGIEPRISITENKMSDTEKISLKLNIAVKRFFLQKYSNKKNQTKFCEKKISFVFKPF